MVKTNCHIAVSETNKILFEKNCKKEFLDNHPELEGTSVTHNQLMTSMIRHYLGNSYFKFKDEVENGLRHKLHD